MSSPLKLQVAEGFEYLEFFICNLSARFLSGDDVVWPFQFEEKFILPNGSVPSPPKASEARMNVRNRINVWFMAQSLQASKFISKPTGKKDNRLVLIAFDDRSCSFG